ncbi:hypothetical protein CO033_01515 [Candidatus Nomurabacteria bacterium CG_4_9_14_0_2_um_filter_32_10]|uniref:Uncharacterized protein n=1 Tax=Candidatus Nomurabacteria bacterium CG_4_9_14_0_2_um_filter_32_10 TaxID=1974729 RepID=A0A2J0N8I5_9BACT|nr:MAG: hypothetical protein CO033_01515 [Candidatus Nomurabacteria bacterium CG_4_9_14_0_2_um_filter_32_10]
MTLTLLKKSGQGTLFDVEPTNEFGVFPSTRYQGSKNKILDWISYSTKDLNFNTVLDAFGDNWKCWLYVQKTRKTSFLQ